MKEEELIKEAKQEEVKDKSAIEKRRLILHTIFLIVLIIAVASLIAAIVTIHRYADMLTNPVGYNLQKFDIPYCQYINEEGKLIQINAINKTI